MKKALPYLITFVVVVVAIGFMNAISTVKEVDENGKPVADGKKYKTKYFGGKKK